MQVPNALLCASVGVKEEMLELYGKIMVKSKIPTKNRQLCDKEIGEHFTSQIVSLSFYVVTYFKSHGIVKSNFTFSFTL